MQKRRKNRLLLFKNGEVKMRKVIKIFIIFTIGFNCLALTFGRSKSFKSIALAFSNSKIKSLIIKQLQNSELFFL